MLEYLEGLPFRRSKHPFRSKEPITCNARFWLYLKIRGCLYETRITLSHTIFSLHDHSKGHKWHIFYDNIICHKRVVFRYHESFLLLLFVSKGYHWWLPI